MKQNSQVENIKKLRENNYSISQIARTLDISVNTVKSICRRYGFTTSEEVRGSIPPVITQDTLSKCKYCGRLMDNPWHRKQKSFCSDKCRYDYWNQEKRLSHYISSPRRKDLSEEGLDFLP